MGTTKIAGLTASKPTAIPKSVLQFNAADYSKSLSNMQLPSDYGTNLSKYSYTPTSTFDKSLSTVGNLLGGTGSGDLYTVGGQTYRDTSAWNNPFSTDTKVTTTGEAITAGTRGADGKPVSTDRGWGGLGDVASGAYNIYNAYTANQAAKEANQIKRDTLNFNIKSAKKSYNASALQYNKYSAWQDKLSSQVNKNRVDAGDTGSAGLSTNVQSEKIEKWK